MGNKKVDLSVGWVIKKRLTNTETQKLLILARSANMGVLDDDHFYMADEEYPHLTGNDNRLDMLPVLDTYAGYIHYTYKEVLDALVKRIKKNSTKSS